MQKQIKIANIKINSPQQNQQNKQKEHKTKMGIYQEKIVSYKIKKNIENYSI